MVDTESIMVTNNATVETIGPVKVNCDPDTGAAIVAVAKDRGWTHKEAIKRIVRHFVTAERIRIPRRPQTSKAD